MQTIIICCRKLCSTYAANISNIELMLVKVLDSVVSVTNEYSYIDAKPCLVYFVSKTDTLKLLVPINHPVSFTSLP